jgi:hypothetical protein
VPITRAITDLTSMFSQKRINGGTPVGYSGKAALRRELSITYYIDILLCTTMVIQFLTSDVIHCTKLRRSTLHNFGTETSLNNQFKITVKFRGFAAVVTMTSKYSLTTGICGGLSPFDAVSSSKYT